MTFEKAHERYRNDAAFRHLVDALVGFVDRLEFSPGELREAAVFAEIVALERSRRLAFAASTAGRSRWEIREVFDEREEAVEEGERRRGEIP